MLSGVVLGLILAGAVLGAIYWTSTEVTKHVAFTIEGLDGVIINIASFADYGLKTVPENLDIAYGDSRDNSFVVCVEDTNIDGDLLLTIEAIGTDGVVVSAKMAWMTLYSTATQGDRISVFDDSGVFNVNNYIYQSPTYATVDFSPMRSIAVDGSITIPNADLGKVTYHTVALPDDTNPVFTDCNGLWLQFTFDTSDITDWGSYSYDISITVSLGEV